MIYPLILAKGGSFLEIAGRELRQANINLAVRSHGSQMDFSVPIVVSACNSNVWLEADEVNRGPSRRS